jgi:hypothetical protein
MQQSVRVLTCVVSLKFPAFVPDVGWFKAFKGVSISSSPDSTKVAVSSVLKDESWADAKFEFIYLENCVVSRYMVKE